MSGGLNIGKAPDNKAVLPFYGTAAFFFVVVCGLLFSSSDSFFSTQDSKTHYFIPQLLTIVHIAAIGWGTMVIFGAAYQLLPVVCENNLYSSNLAFTSYLFLTIGVSILGYVFWTFSVGFWMILGGGLVVIAALLYIINAVITSKINFHSTLERKFIFTSSLWFLITVTLGLLLAINMVYPIFSVNHLEILKLHAHAGLAGWFLQLITGISIKLIPMFLLGKSKKDGLIKGSLYLQNSGLLLFLIDGFYFGVTFRSLIYGLIVIAGIVLWLLYIRDVFTKRMKKKIDLPMKQSLLSFVSLLLSLVMVPILFIFKDIQWIFLYGLLLFIGWISTIILGMTFKTLPFIVWNNHYKKLNGKARIPLPKDLYKEKILDFQFKTYLIALPVSIIGLIVQIPIIFQIGTALLVLVGMAYLINVIIILTHKTTILS